MGMKVCGPKSSTCCSVISTWGVIMLVLMGVFFRVNSVALLEDLPHNMTNSRMELDAAYAEVSNNCFIAAGIYVLLLVFSVWQMRVNKKEQYNVQ